ncbi:hypothetical protein HYY75_08670 [bacterium]|nr:hypothetical protein [bacterium]
MKAKLFLSYLVVIGAMVFLAGCEDPNKTSRNANSSQPASSPKSKSIQTGSSGNSQVVQSPNFSDLVIAFQELDMAIVNFRNMEAANTGSTGFFRGVGYVSAATNMNKKRDAFERLLAQANSSEVPDIAEIRKAYSSFSPSLKGYITVTNVNGVLSGPDAKASTASYLLLSVATLKFRNKLNSISQERARQPLPRPGVSTSDNDLMVANKALIAAYEKYTNLVNSQAPEAEVKIAAEELSIAKSRVSELQGTSGGR